MAAVVPMPRRIKQADPNQPGPEQQFEQSFASMAYSVVREQAPKLFNGDSFVGFQLLDRSSDEKKAAGVFGFRPGNQWIYVPVFFVSGKLKGYEAMWVKDRDLIVPCKENWVNWVMARKPISLGKDDPADTGRANRLLPDLRPYTLRPRDGRYTKYSQENAAKLARFPQWSRDAIPMLVDVMRHKEQGEPVDALLKTALSHPQGQLAFVKLAATYPGIEQGMRQFHPGMIEETRKLADAKSAAASRPRRESLLSLFEEPYVRRSILTGQPKEAAKGGVTLIRQSFSVTFGGNLTDKERSELLTDGETVVDTRDDKDKSEVYRKEQTRNLTNPSESGMYEVASFDGKSFKAVVLYPELLPVKTGPVLATVINPEGDAPYKACRMDIGKIWVVKQLPRDEFASWLDKAPRASGLEDNDEVYDSNGRVFYDAKGRVAGPYSVSGRSGSKYHIHRCGCCSRDYSPPTTLGGYSAKQPVSMSNGTIDNRMAARNLSCDATAARNTPPTDKPFAGANEAAWGEFPSRLVVRDEAGVILSIRGNTLIVPADAAAIRVDTYGFDNGKQWNADSFGSPADDREFFSKNHAKVAVECDFKQAKPAYKIVTPTYVEAPRNRPAAIYKLMSDYGMSRKSAEELLDESREKKAQAVGWVKKADLMPGGRLPPGAGAPPWPEVERTQDNRNGAIVQPSFQHEQYVEGLPEYPTFRDWDMQSGLGPVMQRAQEAQQRGDREAFTPNLFRSIIKATAGPGLVDNDIPTLLKAVDALGRIHLKHCYNGELFGERYGKDDMPEMGDAVRDAFISLGDLTLVFQEKDVSSAMDDDMAPNLGQE